jgi:radical SAM superfamily enzyme YgiQ (UPF0313 family)
MKIILISTQKMKTSHPPLGIAYLAAVLKENGYNNIQFIDNNTIQDDKEIERLIRKSQPDMVGITIMTMQLHEAEKIAGIIKKIEKSITIIAGGPHPTIMPEETLENKNIDIAVIGEGEYTFPELVKSLENKKPIGNINGICYKLDGKLKRTKPREPILNIDELPHPARDLLPMEYYLSNIPQYPLIMPVTHICAIRGCPFNCSFCQPTVRKLFGNKVRYRSPENVVDEMEYVAAKYKLGSINIDGDTLTANKKWIISLCDNIKERKLDIPWYIGTRVNTVTKEILQKMKDSGCYFIQFGVESGSQRILDEIMQKGITLKQTKDCFKWCHKVGILTNANIMIGSPTETRHDIFLTYKLLKELEPEYISAYITNPLPGTYLYDIAKSKKLLKTEDISQLERHGKGTMKRELDDDELEKYIKLFWGLAEQQKIRNILDFYKKKHILKCSLKRDASILKSNPLSFFKNMIRKPITVLALIKYNLIQKHKTITLLEN